jgi:diamine N-acetyltransferase
MQELNIKLLPAIEKDLELISGLAAQIWPAHYEPIIGKSQVDYMLAKMYNVPSLKEQITLKNHVFYLIALNAKVVGFISVNQENSSDWFLNKFYLLNEVAGKGSGTLAFEELKKIIQPKKLTLTVNRQNYKSINFYFKNKFKIDRVADFDIGDGFVMNDFVMVWEENN